MQGPVNGHIYATINDITRSNNNNSNSNSNLINVPNTAPSNYEPHQYHDSGMRHMNPASGAPRQSSGGPPTPRRSPVPPSTSNTRSPRPPIDPENPVVPPRSSSNQGDVPPAPQSSHHHSHHTHSHHTHHQQHHPHHQQQQQQHQSLPSHSSSSSTHHNTRRNNHNTDYEMPNEVGVSKRSAPMWSPTSDISSNHKAEQQFHIQSTPDKHHQSLNNNTQSEIEKLDELLMELTPRLSDSPSEYLRRRRQSFSNSSTRRSQFEGRTGGSGMMGDGTGGGIAGGRQEQFIQGFSPTTPPLDDAGMMGGDDPSMMYHHHQQHQSSSHQIRASSHSDLHTGSTSRYYYSQHQTGNTALGAGGSGTRRARGTSSTTSIWMSHEKRRLQRTRSLLDEKDRYLTEQLRRYQMQRRVGGGGNSNLPWSPNRPGSSHQMRSTAADYYYYQHGGVSGGNPSYYYHQQQRNYPGGGGGAAAAGSEWDDVRRFNSEMWWPPSGARRANSEIEYPLRGAAELMESSAQPPMQSPGPNMYGPQLANHRRRPFIRHNSDREEFSYSRPKYYSESIYRVGGAQQNNSSRTYSPSCGMTGYAAIPPSQPPGVDYPLRPTPPPPPQNHEDIPLVYRRNVRPGQQKNNAQNPASYYDQYPTQQQQQLHPDERNRPNRMNESLPCGSALSPQPPYMMDQLRNEITTPDLLNKARNSGFQIRAEASARISGISYHDPPTSADELNKKMSNKQHPDHTTMNTKDQNSTSQLQNHDMPTNRAVDRTNNLQQSQQQHQQLSVPGNSSHGNSNASIRKTAKYWYQPHMTRDDAIKYLIHKCPGSFIIRQSHTFNNSYGLAVKVPRSNNTEDDDKSVRHFLIESSTKGVRIRGCQNEPFFGSLTALVHQHTLTRLALPCPLVLPPLIAGAATGSGGESDEVTEEVVPPTNTKTLANFATKNFSAIYLGSIETESLTGPTALARAVEVLLDNRNQVKQTEVSLRVGPDGITLTDTSRKLFFRRHYPLNTISHCGVESQVTWDSRKSGYQGSGGSRIFGFVARKSTQQNNQRSSSSSSSDNMCHLLCEWQQGGGPESSARTITHFMSAAIHHQHQA